jgi:hypothetical protein
MGNIRENMLNFTVRLFIIGARSLSSNHFVLVVMTSPKGFEIGDEHCRLPRLFTPG